MWKKEEIVWIVLLTLLSLPEKLERSVVFIMALGLIISTTRLTTYNVTYECMQEADKVESIRIYELNERGVEVVDDRLTPYKIIKESEYEGFIEGIENLPFEDTIILALVPTDPNFSYYGYVVKISYKNGAYEIISSNEVQKQVTESGDKRYTHYSCDEIVWFKYISKYQFNE